MSPRNASDGRGSPVFIVLFWLVVGFGLLTVFAAILLGGYQ